jgi:hypothetical protein
LQHIGAQNKVLLTRIQNTIPSYRHIEWERDAEKRVEYLRNMTEFPDLFVPPTSKFSTSKSASTKLRDKKRTEEQQRMHDEFFATETSLTPLSPLEQQQQQQHALSKRPNSLPPIQR